MILLIFILLTIYFISERILKKNRAKRLGWKTFKKDHETYIYSERVNNKWEEIEITRVYESGSFYILFKNKEEWKSYPIWAQDRDKIVGRVSRSFPDDQRKSEIDEIGSHLKP